MKNIQIKKLLLSNFPYVICFYIVDKGAWLFRHCTGDSWIVRMGVMLSNFKLAFVSQLRRAEYDFTVYDAVMMGRYSRMPFWGSPGANDSQAVDMALERVGAAQFKKRSLRELSGGELQRVFLARALAQESAYLLLDEPITGLDIRFQHEFLALIRELCNDGMCAVCVLHDLALAAQYSEKMALMSKGRLYALGSPEKILTPLAIADVFNLNGGLFEHNGKYYIETFS